MTKKKKVLLTVSVVILFAVVLLTALWFREGSLRRATQGDGRFSFDGLLYEEIDFREIEPYNETWKVVCKTTDGSWVLYEIKQYPDHEYLVARLGWEASVIKRVDN